MKPKSLNIPLLLVDLLLAFVVFGVLPFAWLLRDGLGPDSVTSTGLLALSRGFMSFYVGPMIILLVVFDQVLRRRKKSPAS